MATKIIRCLAACVTCFVFAGAGWSHPIVSTDINRHVTLLAARDGLTIHYLYNMLEVAAVNVGRTADTDADGQVSDAERDAYAHAWSRELTSAMHVSLDGQTQSVAVQQVKWELGPAPFGLHTWTLTAELRVPWTAPGAATLRYRDTLRPGEVGWKEVILQGEDVQLEGADVLSRDRSARLTDYQSMADLPNPDQTAATARLLFDVASRDPSSTSTAQAASQPAPGRWARPREVPPRETATGKTQERNDPTPASAAVSDPPPPPAPVVATAAQTPPATGAAPQASPWHHYALPFFRLGMHHIAIGWDHLAFLLGLLLFRQRLGRLVWVVTAFTLAHSCTLALAAAGWVNPPGQWVETLIALSIAYVGVMALWRPDYAHGPWLALGFGLVHGFGFAGALSESLGEMGGNAWLVALASFNFGIEVLQLLLVATAFAALRRIDRFTSSTVPRRALAGVVIVLGLWWTIERIGPALMTGS